MDQQLHSELVDSGIRNELASLIANHSRALPEDIDRSGMGLLEQTRNNPTSPAVIVSKHPRNLLINWKDLVFSVLPTTVGAVAATTAAPVTGGLALLAAVYQLIGTCQIELSEPHADVVRSLWVDLKETQPVPRQELLATLSGDRKANLPGILKDLSQLGIVELMDQDRILKKDRLVLKHS